MIKDKTISGIKWTTVSTISNTLINIIKISLLARLLDKSDFGLMALVLFVLGFMNLFMDLGFTSAILHKQDISRNEYASLYWLNVGFSFVLFFLIWILSPVVAQFYNEPELQILIPLMGSTILITALGKQFRTIELKNLNFKNISLVDVLSGILGLFVSIGFALKNYGVYSLVYGYITVNASINLFFFIRGIVKIGLLFHFNITETRPFLKIGLYQVGGQIVNYFNRDLDLLIIGKLIGVEALGGYSLAKQLIQRPRQIIDPVFARVGNSVLPKFQSDNDKLRSFFKKIFISLGSINSLVYGLIIIFAEPLVMIFYGQEYNNISQYVQLFAFLIYLKSMGSMSGLLVITKGRTDLEFLWNLINLLIFPAAIFAGSRFSIEMIIIFMICTQIMLLIPGWSIFYKRLVQLPLKTFLSLITIPALISLPFVLISFHFDSFFQKVLISIFFFISLLYYAYTNSQEIKNYLCLLNQKYFN